MGELGTAILLFGNDVNEEARAAYEHWHSRHHVPQRLTVPGILGAIRFRLAGRGSPEYLTLYRLRDVSVLESPRYRALLDHPDPPTREMRPKLAQPRRFVASVGSVPLIPAGFLMQARQGRNVIEARAAKDQVTMEGPLVGDQRNHPIMGAEPLPEGYLQLRFARPGEFSEREDAALLPIGGLYSPIDRFGLDAHLFG